MIDTILDWDTRLLVWLNGFHHSALDPVMYLLSQTWFWTPLYAVLLWLLIRDHRKHAWIVLAGITITIVFTDQVTSTLMKPFFARLRPSHEPSLENVLHFVNDLSGNLYKGGMYGFASSHAANTFGTATFFVLMLRQSRSWMYWLFAWAVLMTYTRIYMGVHYPTDILVGACVGLLGGWLGFRSSNWFLDRRDRAVENS